MNTVLFTEWFDTQNPRHVRAWEYMLKYNQFPVSFEIPEQVVFDPGWFENIRQRLEFVNEVDQQEQLVMRRDASFWRCPGRGGRFHHVAKGVTGPLGHPTAKCDARIQLDPESATTSKSVRALVCMRCKRMRNA